MSHTLTCLAGLGSSPDSVEKSCNDEFSKTNEFSETKLSSDFKTEIFLVNNYQKPIRRDRNEFGGGLMQFVRKGVVCNRVLTFESPNIEVICSDLMVCKRDGLFSAFTDPQMLPIWNCFLENCLPP